ncbi:MAG: acetyl-CoA carboxylase biotin carboxyl carrier protein [bacterium]|nr:acetyl-CoA carboxylase biotin carboxyl carrier protein [Candidatus Sumerlaeota bacterium]
MAERVLKKKADDAPEPLETGFSLEIEDIKLMMQLMKENEIAELDIEQGGAKVRIVSARASTVQPHQAQQYALTTYPQLVIALQQTPPPPSSSLQASPSTPESESDAVEAETATANLRTVTSPMVGTFYRAPAPDAAPFIDIGSVVSDDTVLCIIEAMKLLNEIKAEMRGRVHRILVENGMPVEYNQPLFLIETG